ncbi:hypothetical protein ANN_27118 [Periplaneta americana]|uniref:Uncharacterized protein n=1 Tax=Periplaneta americana TaxID=6978 RepID=A0ABQ8RXB5_PERAM|nr:hypothetical protein ANN_27118 [Periplaneta americana]
MAVIYFRMLNEVLTHHKPDSWDSESYTNKRYKQVQVFGMEHSRVLEEFSSDLRSRVEAVYRVQNPYLYGRYKLRVEQLQLRNDNVYEEKWYHPIAEDDMNVVMEYNCDYRRYTNPSLAQYNSKKPRFYKTPEAAEESVPTPTRLWWC